MVSSYRVKLVVFPDGERFPLLVRADDGMPLFDPCVYATSVIRPRSGSSATIDQALRGVQLLLTFADVVGIELDQRVGTGRFLDLHELDALVATAYHRLAQPDEPGNVDALADRRGGNSKTGGADAAVSARTAAIRLHYAANYLKWLGGRAAARVGTTLERRHAFSSRLLEFLEQMKARIPSARSQPERTAMARDEVMDLVRLIDPSNPANPWSDPFVRERNHLLVHWALGTGLRRGELLGLTVDRINFRANTATIVRRADDKRDPRARQPATKTRGRVIAISEELAALTHAHVVKSRAKIRGARKHGFLFVADDGKPLSLSAVTKIFGELRDRLPPSFDTRLTMHVLRHNWNEAFSDIADQAAMSEEDERRARIHAMGWSDNSKSADHYLRRRTQRLGNEASVEMQKRLLGNLTEGSSHDD